jgi:hypothetical protein
MTSILIIIDTNAIHESYLFNRVPLQTILKEREKLALKVALPQVSLLEHAKHYWKSYSDAVDKMRNLDGPTHGLKELRFDSAVDLIRNRANDAGIEILPIPDVTHEKLVDRAIRGQRPFSPDGKEGYRDALIWETVKYHANEFEIAFITNDTDFGKSKSGEQDPALRTELEALAHKVTIHRTLKHFVDEAITPKLTELHEIEQAIRSGKLELGPQEDFKILLETEAKHYRAASEDFLLDLGNYSAIRIRGLQGEFKVDQVEARLFHDGDVLLRLTVNGIADLVGEYWRQISEDEAGREWDLFDQVPVKVELEVIATANVDTARAISIKRIAQR